MCGPAPGRFDGDTIQQFPPSFVEILRVTIAEREAQYGSPADHWSRTVAMLNIALADKLREPLTVGDWPIMMMCDKLARASNGFIPDHALDVAGYAAGWSRVMGEG
jgi:hypothetical protein